MTALALLLVSIAPISGSLGFVFTDNYPATKVIGNIYSGDFAYSPWSINQVYFGVTADFAYKRANPFANDYLGDPDLSLTFGSLGVGPNIFSRLNDAFGIGFNMVLNCQVISYPETGPMSKIVYRSATQVEFGTNLYATFTPIRIGNFNLGLVSGIYLNGTGDNSYQSVSEDQPLENSGIYGFSLKIRIERRP